MIKRILPVALIALASLTAMAEKTDPVTGYYQASNYAMLSCSMSLKLAISLAEAKSAGADVPASDDPTLSDWLGCIKRNKTDLKTQYETALKTVKKPGAKAALKEHFIAIMTNLDEIDPRANEIKIDYNRRQSTNEQKLAERWNRFEVER